jgi:guanosine-3',5'-bis(diphosphate) 3'-pyrophosphohydrolase
MEVQDLLDKIAKRKIDVDCSAIKRACNMMIASHGDQLRASGDLYYSHPLAVACSLVDMGMDTASIITGLLHDTVEDTHLTLEDIRTHFGDTVARLVDGVTKLKKIYYQPEQTRQAENFRKLLLAMSEDIRVLLVKLADRMHNMETLDHIKSPEKRERIARETMDIYAPLAERIGMHRIKSALQDLAFRTLHPDIHASITNRLDFLRDQGKLTISHIVESIHNHLNAMGIKALVDGREKTPCSIWFKMEKKNIPFEKLCDIIAFRVLVDTPEDCYRSLGALHLAFPMVPDSFKDFISVPKPNGYQSLHTVVHYPEHQRVEIQIRTHTMHDMAEFGVAAHWHYKQNPDQFRPDETLRYRWIRELLLILEHTNEPEDFLHNTKLEISYDQVFCFTPKGELIALPKNATPVDFAFALHSDIGRQCIGAKINSRVVPLRSLLQNGDEVEILCSKHQTPSPSWEKFVVTGKARTEIRRALRQQKRQEKIAAGSTSILEVLQAIDPRKKLSDLLPLLPMLKKHSLDDLCVAVGDGSLGLQEVTQALQALSPNRPSLTERFKQKWRRIRGTSAWFAGDSSDTIQGHRYLSSDPLAPTLSDCCRPLPGDAVVAWKLPSGSMALHLPGCLWVNKQPSDAPEWVDFEWDSKATYPPLPARVEVVMFHEIGALATLSQCIATLEGNIIDCRILEQSRDFVTFQMDVEVQDATHFRRMVHAIQQLEYVHEVTRPHEHP